MNYYDHHLGDYLRDTAHLSMLEDGAYRRLLDIYYMREAPLPSDQGECCKLARCMSAPERKAVIYVLEHFLILEPDGYHQKRADEVIAAYRAFVAKQRANGRSGADKRWDSQRHSTRHRSGNGTGHGGGHSGGDGTGHSGGYANGHGGGDGGGGSQTMASHSPPPTSHQETPLPPMARGVSRRSAQRAEQDTALLVWHELIASEGARPERDERLQAAIDAVGGWSRIALREQGMGDAQVRKAFVLAYRRLS